jgi:hypothetical protein
VVKHIVTDVERPLVYTDRAMTEDWSDVSASQVRPGHGT